MKNQQKQEGDEERGHGQSVLHAEQAGEGAKQAWKQSSKQHDQADRCPSQAVAFLQAGFRPSRAGEEQQGETEQNSGQADAEGRIQPADEAG